MAGDCPERHPRRENPSESTPAAGIPDLDALLHARYGAAAPALTEPALRESATLAALLRHHSHYVR